MTYSSEVLSDSPLAFWRLGDVNSATTAADSSGNSHSGTYASGGKTDATGLLVGDADAAAALGNYITVTSGTWMDVSAVTVEIIVKPSGSPSNKGIMSRFGSSDQAWLVWFNVSGKIGARFYDTGGSQVDLTWATTPTSGATYHVAATYTAGQARLYIDGVQVDSSTALTGNLRTNTTAINLGTYQSSASFAPVGTTIDEAAVYSGVLSAGRIAAHSDASKGVVGTPTVEGTLAATSSLTATSIKVGVVTAALTATAALSATVMPVMSASANLTATASFSATSEVVGAPIERDGTLNATSGFTATSLVAYARTGSLTASAGFTATIEVPGVIPAVTGSLAASASLSATIEVPILAWTDTTNRLGGRHRGGYAVATWEPPVITPPPGLEPPVAMDVARAMTAPTIAAHGPAFTVTKAEQRADRTRILVGGKDITYFRGVRTPTPDYQLVEPLLYSDATIELPQVYGMWETLGTGSLKWAKLGKTVVIQRVNDAGEVVGTDYRGKIMDYDLSGPTTRLLCGGEAEGPASTMIRPLPVFKFTSDAGARMHNSLNRIGLRTKSFNLMADTGIDINSVGSMTELEFIQQVCSVAVTRAGEQYTITRLSDGTWDFRLKDTTTIHATAYFDDAGIVPNLRRDMRAEPNRIFGSGITPDGRRFRNAKYEGLVQGVAAPYPFTDGSAFGEGTTNADTDTGDGVSVMILRLNTFGYISRRDLNPGTYDDAVSEAIEELQDDAGLPQTGNMNQATWAALWDIDVTGYSAERTSVNPIAQRSSTRRYNYSATGQIMGINENYDPSVMVVDESLDFGTQVKVRQMRRWSRRRLNQSLTPNWIGTLDINTALIQGEHNPGDPLSGGLVMTNRHLRPGMNIWAPLFDGGTLFHVSGISVSDDGQTVRAVVDTRARDLMAAWEIHTRNQETARNTARGRFHQWRQSGIEKDAIGPWDTYGGLVQEIELQQGWNVFEVVAGQEGTIQRMRIATDDPTEFAVLVSGLRIGKKRLASLVPNPLADPGEGVVWYEKRAVRKALRDRLVLVSYGTHDQPCGYGDRVKVKDGEATGAPLTGVMDQSEGFTYNTFDPVTNRCRMVLHVAVYAKEATKIPAGRMLWNAADAGS